MVGFEDDDDDYYGDEMMIPMTNFEPYYDELDDDDYYDEEIDGVAANDSSSSSSDSSDEDDIPQGDGTADVQINVEITDKKNQIIDVPLDAIVEHEDVVHQKADNDMETSDLAFSDNMEKVDEHAYQIGELGDFEAERSFDEQQVIEGINKDHSVDFSEGDFSLMSELSHEAVHAQSENSNDVEEDYLSSDSYSSSEELEGDLDSYLS